MGKRLLLIGVALILVVSIVGCEANGVNGQDKEYELTEDGIIDPGFAKEIIEHSADRLILAISDKDAETIAEFVHPIKGLRFSPYAFVSPEEDIVFAKGEIKDFFNDKNVYLWGIYDGRGNKIYLTPSEYYERFIYSEDFKNADEVNYNEILSVGSTVENQFEVYEKPIIVEYYFPGIVPEYGGTDWKGLRLVFEEYEGEWMLVGIIHSQWTI